MTRRLILCCVAVAIWLSASVMGATQQACQAEDAASPPIKIGVLLPFSGGVELYGNQAKMGIDLAAKEINAGGGILGRPVQLVYEDDHTRPEHADPAMRKLIDQDKVLAVIGPITSQNLGAVFPIAEEKKTPLLYATNYEGGKNSRYFFSFSTVPNQELAPLFPFMKKKYGDTFYMLGLDAVWPHLMFALSEPLITEAGGKVVGKKYIPGGNNDLTSVIKEISDSKAKVLVYALKGNGVTFIPQAEKQGLLKKITVAYIGLSEADLSSLGGGQNMHVVVPFVAASDAPKAKEFVSQIKKDAGADAVVSNYAMTHYNAMMALKAALEKSGKADDKEALIDALVGVEISTPAGHLKMEQNHHSTMNVFLAKTKGPDLVIEKELGEIGPGSATATQK